MLLLATVERSSPDSATISLAMFEYVGSGMTWLHTIASTDFEATAERTSWTEISSALGGRLNEPERTKAVLGPAATYRWRVIEWPFCRTLDLVVADRKCHALNLAEECLKP